MDALVTTEWLDRHRDEPNLRIVDATYTSTLPGSVPGDPAAAFAAGHIPGAVFLDLDTLVDRNDPLPSMRPPPDIFAARMNGLGIGNATRIVLYDDSPHHTAARAWWVMRSFGVTHVALLDGGLGKWRSEGRPLTSDETQVTPATFVPSPEPAIVRSLDKMRSNAETRAEQVIDARSFARFAGLEADPRPEVAPGHIPGSVNLPYHAMFTADGTWKEAADLRAAFEHAGLDLDQPIVTTCGSGITAAVLAFGLERIGCRAALYDGSWSEWGADPSTPKLSEAR